MQNIDVSEAHFDDFAAMETAFHDGGWEARYQQMSAGAFDGYLATTTAGPGQIIFGLWGEVIRHRGLQPKGTQSLAFTLSTGEPVGGHFLGTPIGPTDAIFQGGQNELELLSKRNLELGILSVDEAVFSASVAALSQKDPDQLAGRQGLVRLGAREHARIRRELKRYSRNVRASGHSSKPDLALRRMAEDLIELAIRFVVDAHFEPLPAPRLERRVKLVRQAEELVRSNDDSAIRVTDLCAELKVSERTLRYAFAELTEMSPAAYLRTQRLNRVRRILAAADPETTRVNSVAYEHGFWHLGQFAHDYLKHFGERPSETLRGSGALGSSSDS